MLFCVFGRLRGLLAPNGGSWEAENWPVAAVLCYQVCKSSEMECKEGEKEILSL